MIQKVLLVLREAASGKFISLIVFLSIVMSVAVSLVFCMAGATLNNFIDRKFAASIPPNVIKISPKPPKTILLFEFRDAAGGVIDDRALSRIRAMKGIKDIFPVLPLRVPLQARVSFLGFNYATDAIAIGVPYELIRGDLSSDGYRGMWVSRNYGAAMPVLVPDIMLTAYNSGLAEANSLPKRSERDLLGYKFRFIVGRSSISGRGEYDDLEAFVAGFTGKIDAIAAILPFDAVEHYNKKYIGESYRREYSTLYVWAHDHESMVSIRKGITGMGFQVEAEKSVSEQILGLKKTVDAAVRSLLFLIILISSVAVSFSGVIAALARIDHYRILRIIGASKLFISFSVLVKYFLLGLIGSAAGVFMVHYMSQRISGAVLIPFMKVSFTAIGDEFYRKALIYGTLIPVLSSIPALVTLYCRDLGRD